jgi:diaminohydroxyphosphoribosylaminopyrimidine deaminase/5-amino-6-(5-phosphoribosylamino)uracil reductase
MNHQKYMQHCIDLANKGIGNVAPNPLVGAVLVHQDKIIGEGWHQKYGEAHAEVNCINSVSEENKKHIEDSTLYVSLEPCNHFGKTPPCSDLILKHHIKKVVVGCVDANPKVGGSGIKKLVDNNVEVIYPVLEHECMNLNKRFFTFHQKHRPYIFLKWAQTNDTFIAHKNFKPIKISNEIVDAKMHQMRRDEAAIMVGFNTALHDNPKLTARKIEVQKQPLRIVIDKNNQLPTTHFLMNDEHSTLLLNTHFNKTEKNKEFLKIDFNENFIPQLLNELYLKNINSIIIEGGTILLQSFIDKGLWDEAIVITNIHINIDEGIEAPKWNETSIKSEVIENNLIEYYQQ